MYIDDDEFGRFHKSFNILNHLYAEKCMLEDGETIVYIHNLLNDLLEALGSVFEDAINYDADAYLVDADVLEHLLSVCEEEE